MDRSTEARRQMLTDARDAMARSLFVPFEAREAFVSPVLFGGRSDWGGRAILCAGPGFRAAQTLAREFPGARVVAAASVEREPDGEDRVEFIDPSPEAIADGDREFDYALVRGQHCGPGPDPKALLTAAVSRLKPDGVLVGSVFGRHGRHGMVVVAEMVRRVLPYAEGMSPAQAALTVLNSLPPGHHFRLRDQFATELDAGGESAFEWLAQLRAGDLYTAPQVLELVAAAGAEFLGWFWPASYDPTLPLEDPEAIAALADVPEPTRSTVSELITASPTSHCFVAAPAGAAKRPEPPWDSAEALSWRPCALPTYPWAEAPVSGDVVELRPTPRTEYTGKLTLRAWQARLGRAADGQRSVRELLAITEVRQAFDAPKAEWEAATLLFLRQACHLRALCMLPPAS